MATKMAKTYPIDRFAEEGGGIDVLLMTLDAERFLVRSLRSLYAEVPVCVLSYVTVVPRIRL